MLKRRKRSPNYTQEENHLLLDLVQARFAIVANGMHDFITIDQKEEEWDSICKEYNSKKLHVYRSADHLRTHWKRLKMIIISEAESGKYQNSKISSSYVKKVYTLIAKYSGVDLEMGYDSELSANELNSFQEHDSNESTNKVDPLAHMAITSASKVGKTHDHNYTYKSLRVKDSAEIDETWSTLMSPELIMGASSPLRGTEIEEITAQKEHDDTVDDDDDNVESVHKLNLQIKQEELQIKKEELQIRREELQIKREELKHSKLKTRILLLELRSKKNSLNKT